MSLHKRKPAALVTSGRRRRRALTTPIGPDLPTLTDHDLAQLERDWLVNTSQVLEDVRDAERDYWNVVRVMLMAHANGVAILPASVSRSIAETIGNLLESGVPGTWQRAAGSAAHRPAHSGHTWLAKQVAVWYVKAAMGYPRPGDQWEPRRSRRAGQFNFSGLRVELADRSPRRTIATEFGVTESTVRSVWEREAATTQEGEPIPALEYIQNLHDEVLRCAVDAAQRARAADQLRDKMLKFAKVFRQNVNHELPANRPGSDGISEAGLGAVEQLARTKRRANSTSERQMRRAQRAEDRANERER